MYKKLNYEYDQWGTNKKFTDIINQVEKSPEFLRLIKRRQDITKPGNHRFKIDNNLNRNVWVHSRPDKRGRDEVVAIDSELLFKDKELNRWWGGYFEFNERRASLGTKQNKNESKIVSSTEKNDVVKTSPNFPIVDLRD